MLSIFEYQDTASCYQFSFEPDWEGEPAVLIVVRTEFTSIRHARYILQNNVIDWHQDDHVRFSFNAMRYIQKVLDNMVFA